MELTASVARRSRKFSFSMADHPDRDDISKYLTGNALSEGRPLGAGFFDWATLPGF